MHRVLSILFSVTVLCAASPLWADTGWDYGNRGLEWSNPESGSYTWLGLRAQSRFSNKHGGFRVPDEYQGPHKDGTEINRGRYKIGARWRRDISFYHEYDLKDMRLLDLRTTWISNAAFNLRMGQWKAEYNRERIDSSGKQQFVERSIATYWFTVDRQWGLMASGELGEGTALNSNWWGGVLGGTGRSTEDDGGRPMLLGRWQWNYTGNVLPFSQSALKRFDQPHGSLSIAAVTNDSRYTAFSSSGGGSLQGYSEGEDNQYRLQQFMQEWAWQRGGLSFQQELHFKSIKDRINGGKRELYGGYAQVGWFPAERFSFVPPQLELALRGAYVDTDSREKLENEEYTVAANWFFNGHRNKFTADFSYLAARETEAQESELRFRLQWELSI
jgi:phosphate-selective porin